MGIDRVKCLETSAVVIVQRSADRIRRSTVGMSSNGGIHGESGMAFHQRKVCARVSATRAHVYM